MRLCKCVVQSYLFLWEVLPVSMDNIIIHQQIENKTRKIGSLFFMFAVSASFIHFSELRYRVKETETSSQKLILSVGWTDL